MNFYFILASVCEVNITLFYFYFFAWIFLKSIINRKNNDSDLKCCPKRKERSY